MMSSSSYPSLPHHQARASLKGPVSILWDIENCPVPHDVRPEDASGNIRMALRIHPVIDGAVTMFSAYGDFNSFPRRLREGCQRTGVKLIDIPNGRKDSADKAILVDMFLFALDNPPPSSILLISGDVDFAPALHILGQRGYTVILVIPPKVRVSSALRNAGSFVWDWPSVVRGEGFAPPAKLCAAAAAVEISGHLMDPQMSNGNGVIQKEVVSRSSTVAHSVSENSCDNSRIMLQRPTTTSRSNCVPSDINEVSIEKNKDTWVQPRDLNGLKGQIVKLLELSGGFLPQVQLAAVYQKNYGRQLFVSEYGAGELENFIKKMDDVITVKGDDQTKILCLRDSKVGPVEQPVILARREKKGEGVHEEDKSIVDISDKERVLDVENYYTSEKKGGETIIVDRKNLERFRYELMDILVSYSCRFFLGYFEAMYYQRYKRHLDYRSFGVSDLEELLEKVKDVAVLEEEPFSKRKFVVAVGG